MSMDAVANALLFWDIVEASLVELYRWDRAVAHAKVLQLRGRMMKAAIAQDVAYHWDPLNVASDIAHVVAPMSDAMFEAYQELVKRITAQRSDESFSEESTKRKPRADTSEKAHTIAAMSR